MPVKQRLRHSPQQSRARAIEAARALLLEHGPQGVTLKAVAARLGQTHANLLHHFGSAAELQNAVMEDMAQHLVGRIGEAVVRRRHGEIGLADLVDVIFETFGQDGAGRLASWMILTGDRQALDPVFRAIHDYIEQLTKVSPLENVRHVSLFLTLMAIGDALLGAPLAEALDLKREAGKAFAVQQLAALSGFPVGPANQLQSTEALS